MPYDPSPAGKPPEAFHPKSALNHFDDGRQCVLQQMIEQIKLDPDVDRLEKFCQGYLNNILDRASVAG